MILLSSIIKAEYVLFDENKKQINKKVHNQISASKEELYQIYNQREIIIKEAKDEASRIINAAKKNAQYEISESRKKGYEEGYNAGMEMGREKGYEEGYETGNIVIKEELHKEANSKIKEINDMIIAIENEKQNIILKYENEIETLPIEIAEKIIRQKIDLKDYSVTRIIENVIKEFKNVDWVKIYISDKDDNNKIQADRMLIEELQKISNDVKIETSKELSSASCIVETPDSIIYASIDTQLNNLKEILLNK